MLGSTTLHGWVDSALYLSIVEDSMGADTTGDERVLGPTIRVEREFRSFSYQRTLELSFSLGEPGELVYEPRLKQVSDRFEELKMFLVSGKTSTASITDIMDRFSLSRSQVIRLIDRAERGGLITTEGEGRGKKKIVRLRSNGENSS